MSYVLGINAPPTLLPPEQCPYGGHDPSACMIDDAGRVVAFEEQERHSRRRYGVFEYPVDAVRSCLRQAGAGLADVDVVAVGWDVPRVAAATGERWRYRATAEFLDRLGMPSGDGGPELVFVPHHRAHAACSFHGSGLPAAAVLVIDGNGEDECVSVFDGRPGGALVRKATIPQVRSLGTMYAAVSEHLRLGLLSAGKTMGLSAYGRADGLEPWPMLDDEGRPLFKHDDDDGYDATLDGWRQHLGELLPSVRTPRRQLHRDSGCVRLAWSAQHAVEHWLGRLVELARHSTGRQAVCLSGGVALNCSANGLLDGEVFSPPVPHDGGVSLGAAWSVRPPRQPGMMSPFLGEPLTGPVPAVSGSDFRDLELGAVVDLLAAGRVGAIAVGRGEIGPRALGHRSVIALPSHPGIRDRINRAKGREPWRPLAPVSLDRTAARFWRVADPLQRFMLAATEVTDHGREVMPEAVHVDGTARAQTTGGSEVLAALLTELEAAGLPPVLINTSLNARGEPIARTTDDVLGTYQQARLDFLVLDDRLVVRRDDRPDDLPTEKGSGQWT